jgi:hypothetical protein
VPCAYAIEIAVVNAAIAAMPFSVARMKVS